MARTESNTEAEEEEQRVMKAHRSVLLPAGKGNDQGTLT